jgi:CMP-N,N'-diacetyllegionaminic acid synthase
MPGSQVLAQNTIVGLIPARAGSKGILNKNVVDVCGQPLIQWTIDAAQASDYVDRILVTTDDQVVKELAASQGLPVLDRPHQLAGDSSTAAQVIAHALQTDVTEDILVYLQPTSPLRTATDIDVSLELLASLNTGAVVSVTPVTENPEWMYRMRSEGHLLESVLGHPQTSRRQDLPPTVRLNGAVYCAYTSDLGPDGDFFRLALHGFEMPNIRSVDIDTLDDLEVARSLIMGKLHAP